MGHAVGMHKGRLEAFSDGVIAILITIMVLELKVPHGATLQDLGHLSPILLSYVLSFVFIGIYWNNHHHLFQAVKSVNGPVLWANMHLLFWLSLLPFTTGWMGENEFASLTVATYGVVLLASGTAYYILVRLLLAHHGTDSTLARAIGSDFKGRVSLVIYVLGVALAFWNSWVGYVLFAVVAVMWLVPDRRIERAMGAGSSGSAL